MFNLLGNKKLNPFGLEISDRSIKIMQLGKQKGQLFPVAHSKIDLPPNLINNHVITNDDKLSVMISKAVSMATHLSGNHAVVNVPEAKSFVRIVNLPKLDIAEIETALPWELEQDIPMPIDQVYLDWQVIEQTADQTKVLAIATPRDYVDTLLSALKMAKIKPVAVELDSQSIARAVISAEDKDASVLIVDLSSTFTSFAVVSKGFLEYTSSIPLGGNTITENIVQGMGVTAKDAEKLKLETGLLGDSKKGNIKQMMLSVLDSVVDEIRNVIKFHDDHSPFQQPINKVVLCGGGAKLAGIVDYVSARLNIGVGKAVGHVILSDPWVNVADKSKRANFPTDDDSQSYATAVGLALRGYKSDENN
jgi:type IV pilus assembly protein PilM